MIQDIGAFRYHNEYRHISPEEDSKILSYRNGRILLKNRGMRSHFNPQGSEGAFSKAEG